MTRGLAVVVALILLLQPCFGVDSATINDPTKPDPARIPPLQLAWPQWFPLSAVEVRERISDSRLEIDVDYEPRPGVQVQLAYEGGCAPEETFFADGRWRSVRCHRSLRTFEGRWMVGGLDGLCVDSKDWPTPCRKVWQGPTADRLFIAAPGGTVLPYRIVKLPASPEKQD